jgi:hypothetical protein
MLKILRPSPQVLVISERRLQALIRLGIWVGIVSVFYLVVLDGTAPADGESAVFGAGSYWEWLLLLFPLFLLPYLFNCLKALLRSDEMIFDGRSQLVSSRSQALAAFGDIRELHLRAVNGTCEEFCLSATLGDGRHIRLCESGASSAITALADEIAALVGVEVIRGA